MDKSVRVSKDGFVERCYFFDGRRIVEEHVYFEDTCYFAVNVKAAHEIGCIDQVNSLLSEYSITIVYEQPALFVTVLDDDGNMLGNLKNGTKIAIDEWHIVIDQRASVQKNRLLEAIDSDDIEPTLMKEFCRGLSICVEEFDYWFGYINQFGTWDLNIHCDEDEPVVTTDDTGSWCWVKADAYPVLLNSNGYAVTQTEFLVHLGTFRSYSIASFMIAKH